MKRIVLAVLLVGVIDGVQASQEGTLPISSFRLESLGVGDSGPVVIEGRQDDQAHLIALRVEAFGKKHVVTEDQLKSLSPLRANGIRISYEKGYAELGGRTVYVLLQTGFSSDTIQTALISASENGTVTIGKVVEASSSRDADLVQAQAIVVKYAAQAAHDSYDDGRTASFDAVELKLTAPKQWEGMKLVVLLEPEEANPCVRRIGTHCGFAIKPEYLRQRLPDSETQQASPVSLFVGALEDLREIE